MLGILKLDWHHLIAQSFTNPIKASAESYSSISQAETIDIGQRSRGLLLFVFVC